MTNDRPVLADANATFDRHPTALRPAATRQNAYFQRRGPSGEPDRRENALLGTSSVIASRRERVVTGGSTTAK
jgi:hypothetical protein